MEFFLGWVGNEKRFEVGGGVGIWDFLFFIFEIGIYIASKAFDPSLKGLLLSD